MRFREPLDAAGNRGFRDMVFVAMHLSYEKNSTGHERHESHYEAPESEPQLLLNDDRSDHSRVN